MADSRTSRNLQPKFADRAARTVFGCEGDGIRGPARAAPTWLPGKDTAERLLNTTSLKGVRYCSDVFAERGFRTVERPITPSFVLGRMDEYAATYLLDRRQKEWHYELTLKQLAENCIAPTHDQDIPGFTGLMEDVVDRARGRVKKEFGKIYRKVTCRAVEGGGWVKETVDLAQLGQDV
jgi:hypothetical protein